MIDSIFISGQRLGINSVLFSEQTLRNKNDTSNIRWQVVPNLLLIMLSRKLYNDKNILLLLIFILALVFYFKAWPRVEFIDGESRSRNFGTGGDGKSRLKVDRNHSFIFVGGFPRSGTTLMRVMLDAHPDIRCGQETRIIPKFLSFVSLAVYKRSAKERERLKEAGLTKEIIDEAVASFITEIIVRHGKMAPRLCNKDPLSFKNLTYLGSLFPNAKFIFMVRDGRAVANSITSRHVTIAHVNTRDYRALLKSWSRTVQLMNKQCKELGSRCLRVPYEYLVLNPDQCMKYVLEFVDAVWNDAVLHHELEFNKNGGIALSR